MSKPKKITLLIVCVVLCSLLAASIFWPKLHYRAQSDATVILSALRYYAEQHNGNLPNSWDDLRKANIITFLEGNPKGVYISDDVPGLHMKQVIKNIELYQISFGLRPDEITIGDSKVLDADGKEILIIKRLKTKTSLAKNYPEYSLWIAQAMKKGAKQTASDNLKQLDK